MTVAELLKRIIDAYPGATAESMATFKPVFFARLRSHEGEALADAANEVLGTFKPTTRQPFPIPLDFEKHLPNGRLNLAAGGKSLDLKAHRERKVRILAAWRAGQGARAANGIPEVMRALEFVADGIADLMAWDEQPGELLLKRGEVRTAQHRAISQHRRVLHGVPPDSVDVWWGQISAIAAHWGIETKSEDWMARESEAAPRPVAPAEQRHAYSRPDTPTARRLAELAAAKRERRRPAEQRDVPEAM